MPEISDEAEFLVLNVWGWTTGKNLTTENVISAKARRLEPAEKKKREKLFCGGCGKFSGTGTSNSIVF
jgi:hypothetical protein